MEPVNIYQDSAEALIHAQRDRNAAHLLYVWQAAANKTKIYKHSNPPFARPNKGWKLCILSPILPVLFPATSPQWTSINHLTFLCHGSLLYRTESIYCLVFLKCLNNDLQSHDGRIQIFISDAILAWLMKLRKFSKQESERAYFLSISWKHKSGPFRIRIVASSMIRAASEASVTEIQPQTVQKGKKTPTNKKTHKTLQWLKLHK